MVFSVNPSLCTDVPPPSEKIGETGTRLSSAIHRPLFSRFFLGGGDVCTLAKFNLSGNVIISCYARGEGTPSMMVYTGRLCPKSWRSTVQYRK